MGAVGMNELTELVDLPDPSEQPLVHPLDLPQARIPFVRSQVIGALTGPAIGVCLAAIIWFVSGKVVPPIVACVAVVGIGALATRALREQAWAFIPRKRQDRDRRLPLVWELGSAVVLAVVLAIALLLLVFRLDRADVTLAFRQFTFGMGAVTGLLMLGDVVVRAVRGRGRQALFVLPGAVAVIGCVVAGYGILFESARSATSSTVIEGAGTMLVVAALAGVWKVVEQRRA